MISKKHIRKIDTISHIRKKQSDSIISEIDSTRQLLQEKFGTSRLIGAAPSFIAVLKEALAMAKNDESVLLFGEVGTEKELFAQAIHYLSKRKDKPFLALNCAAIPAEFFENELFGHGHCTYVDNQYPQEGYIARAEGGTLFLNEVDSISNEAQDRLLRLLQEKQCGPNKNNKFENVDVRIIAASNITLLHPRADGYFRKDLLYKLDKFSLTIPPLRLRKSDIPLLANFFVKKYTEFYKLKQRTLSETALAKLMSYHWPGNIKELENVIHQCVLVCKGSVIEPVNIVFQFDFEIQGNDEISFKENKTRLIEKFEREYLAKLLIDCKGNINRAIKISQMSRRSFYRKMKKYNISNKNR